MSIKTIVMAIVAVAVVGGGAYFFIGNKDAPASPMPEGAQEMQQAQSNAGAGTIASLMAMGSVKCEVSTSVGAASEGVVYVSGGKMRGDFTSKTQAGTFHASMINDGAYIYTWTDAVPQGMKMPASVATQKSGSANSAPGGFDSSTQVQYSCAPWTADTSLFVPPSNVTFMTLPGAVK